ncbi:MAG: class I SAM-dependent methyltransferase [Candidatus Solibacter sp.]
MLPHSDYYDEHAADFVEHTLTVDMTRLYEPFLEHIPMGGRILDAGCGSGRDTRAFLAQGYEVVAMDASAKMVEAAAALTGQPVLHTRFQEIEWIEDFDGIWACASLLHVPRAEIGDVWRRLIRALKPSAVGFMSFKKGKGESLRNGRFFNDYDEQELRALIEQQEALNLLRLWITGDVRKGREQEQWINAVVRRVRCDGW